MTEPFHLDKVPSKGDLDKIERKLERGQTGDEGEDVDGYTKTDLLRHGIDKERYSRRSISDYDNFGFEGKAILGISTAGAGALVTMFGGDGQSAFLAGLATYTSSYLVLSKDNQYSEDPAKNEELEEAFQEYTDNL